MRSGLSTIQQTLTPEASTILNQSIAEAARRNHGQTTPLHVAATLLASPSGFLRKACIRSHPNSSHPLQCRALELCFSVALERLPAAQSPSQEPPISNALMAALKRAQAHQRRGCPDQQQQPLLAVKVELEQLVISILDDPSVSRVMREASFSSPAVKATIEQSLTGGGKGNYSNSSNRSSISPYRMMCLSNGNNSVSTTNSVVNKNSNLNHLGGCGEEVNKVIEIMMRGKKKNPVLVGDAGIDGVVREVLGRVEKDEIETMKGVRVLSVDCVKDGIFGELGNMVESRRICGGDGGVIVDLGDFKWLVEGMGGGGGVMPEMGRRSAVVAEVAKVVARFSGGKVWLIGTATCETYLRCQVYHSSMETDWDLQAVPITSRSSSLPKMFPRVGSERLLSTVIKAVPNPLLTENSNPCLKSTTTLCVECSNNYDKEVAKLTAFEKSLSDATQDSSKASSLLPQWLQTAKTTEDSPLGKNDQGLLSKQKTQELQKKWRDTCIHLHPKFHQNPPRLDYGSGNPTLMPKLQTPPTLLGGSLQLNNMMNPAVALRPVPQLQTTPKPVGVSLQLNMMNPAVTLRPVPYLQTTPKPAGVSLQLNMNGSNTPPAEEAAAAAAAATNKSPPSSPVRTELVLGRKEADNNNNNNNKELLPQAKSLDKFSNALDADTYKKLLRGLMKSAWWQAEAASSVASAITRCRVGNGKRRERGDTWLLFAGPDRVAKKKMACVLADQICGTPNPVTIRLGTKRDDEETDAGFRGKTATDRIAEAVRRNPFSVILLEDIDGADALVRGGIKRAIEKGRLTDSHGREVGLGNAVFVVTGDWSSSTENRESSRFVDEKKIQSTASGSWQLGLIVREKSSSYAAANKRRASWRLEEEDRQSKARREMGLGLSLDLNLSEYDNTVSYGSHNSSDLTIDDDNEDDVELGLRDFAVASVPDDLVANVDESVVFKPVDAGFVRREIKKTISVRFSSLFDGDEGLSIEVGDDVLEKILGGIWHDRTSLEEWVENVLTPGFERLKPRLPRGDRGGSLVRLVVESDSSCRGRTVSDADWLPSTILV